MSNKNMKKKCVIYARVSSERQVDGYSLDSQIELCTNRALQQGYEIVKIFREEGESGKLDDRTKLTEMLLFCQDKKNGISMVFVYSFSRFFRDTKSHLAVRETLSKFGVGLTSLVEPVEDSPVGRFIETIFAANAQLENEMRAMNVANSLKKRFEEGNITSRPGIGYIFVKKKGEKSKVHKDPNSFYVLQEIGLKIAYEGWTLADASDELNRQKIVYDGNRKFKKFTPKYLSKVFANRFYMGMLQSLRHPEWGEIIGNHEPMFTEEEFNAIRHALTVRKPNIKNRNFLREEFKLRQIVKCEQCGKFLTSSFSKGNGGTYPLYYCTSRGLHKVFSFNGDKMEKEFLKLLESITYDPDYLNFYLEFVKEKYNIQFKRITESYRAIEKSIADLKDAKKIAREKNISGLYTDEDYIEMRDEYDARITILQGQLMDKKLLKMDINTLLNFIRYYFTHIAEAWLNATPEGRVAIGSSIFPDGVTYNREIFSNHSLGRGYVLNANTKKKNEKCEPTGTRTQNQKLKRLLLCQLSYRPDVEMDFAKRF